MSARVLIGMAAIAVALPVLAAEESYVIEPIHSQPQWEARHINMSTQRGSFGKAAGKIMLDRDAKKGSVDMVIDATSIRTFKSDKLTFEGDRVVQIDGDLTMIGVTRPVSFKVSNFVCGENPFNKKPMCGAEATATIKRSDWGMTNGLNTSSPGDEIKLMIPIEAYRDVAS